ncbi:GAF domain-containing protein [Streptomyces sp. NPDC054834]
MLITAAAALFPGAAFAAGSVVNYVAGVVQITFITAGTACSSLAAYVALRSKAKLADEEITAFSENLCSLAATHGDPGTRCAYYALAEDGRSLRRRGQYGDVSQAPDEYTTDEPDGRDLLWALGRKTTVRIDDTLSTSGYPMINLGDGYRSSIIAPVHAGDRPVGVLILDAPHVDAFAETGESLIRLFSLLLGAVHMADRGPADGPAMGAPRRPWEPGR